MNSTTPQAAAIADPRWTYSAYRATLNLDGKFFAIVTVDGRLALRSSEEEQLLEALNTASRVRPLVEALGPFLEHYASLCEHHNIQEHPFADVLRAALATVSQEESGEVATPEESKSRDMCARAGCTNIRFPHSDATLCPDCMGFNSNVQPTPSADDGTPAVSANSNLNYDHSNHPSRTRGGIRRSCSPSILWTELHPEQRTHQSGL